MFSGRGAYLHFGAMLGAIMVLNVYFVIIPGQRELVKAKQAGRIPDPKYGLMGRQRSVHNTYFTLPVLFTMISNHYAGLYGHPVELGPAADDLGGRRAGPRSGSSSVTRATRTRWCWPSGLVMLGLTAIVSLPRPTVDIGPPATFAEVQPVFQARCQPCHATKPTQEGFSAPPKGVILETQYRPSRRGRRSTSRSGPPASCRRAT